MKAPSIPRRTRLIASTVAVIGGFFAYYFFVYMEASRVELEAEKIPCAGSIRRQHQRSLWRKNQEVTSKIFIGQLQPECQKKGPRL